MIQENMINQQQIPIIHLASLDDFVNEMKYYNIDTAYIAEFSHAYNRFIEDKEKRHALPYQIFTVELTAYSKQHNVILFYRKIIKDILSYHLLANNNLRIEISNQSAAERDKIIEKLSSEFKVRSGFISNSFSIQT